MSAFDARNFYLYIQKMTKFRRSIYSIFSAVFFLSLTACGGGSGGGDSSSAASGGPAVVPLSTFTLSGVVSGLSVGSTVLLQNGAETLAINASGAMSFHTPVVANGSFAVTVSSQPAGQVCTVSNGVGSGVVANINNIVVTCSTQTHSIGVSVNGLATGEAVKLQNNGADVLTLNANVRANFATPVAHNGSYSITISEQPVGQICTVSNGSGAGVVSDVANIVVTCSTSSYAIGGSVVGLASGQQVTLSLNGSDALTLSRNDVFTFVTKVAYSGGVIVLVATQPTGQICSVSNGTSTSTVSDITNIKVTCSTTTLRIRGTLTGLSAGQQVTLWNNGADALTLNTNGGFAFSTPLAFGSSLAVTVATQPLSQRCEVANGVSALVAADVSDITISCSTKVAAQFTWLGGSKTVDQKGVASTLGVPSALNIPGARDSAAFWSDADGNLWMLGGWGYELQASLSSVGRMYDLWKFNSTTGEWTWFGRSATYAPTGSYGVKGVADPSNWPAVRYEAASWTDHDGNLWLFGGAGSYGTTGRLNDMWKYSPSVTTQLTRQSKAESSGG